MRLSILTWLASALKQRCGRVQVDSPEADLVPRRAAPILAYPDVLRAGGCSLAIESATILFTDVVGSTELSQRLSPDAVERIRREQVLDSAPGHRRDGRHQGEEPG